MKYEIEQRVTVVRGEHDGVNGIVKGHGHHSYIIELDIPGQPHYSFVEDDIVEYSIMGDINMDHNITEELKGKIEDLLDQFMKDNNMDDRAEIDGDYAEDLGAWVKHYVNRQCGNYDEYEIEEMEEKMEKGGK